MPYHTDASREVARVFVRVKQARSHRYLQIVENRREGNRTVQRVIGSLGRLDQLRASGQVDSLLRSLARFADQVRIVEHRAGFSATETNFPPAASPIVGPENGTFVARVVLELWDLNPGVPGDGLFITVGPISSNAEAVQVLNTVLKKFQNRLHHGSA